MTSVLHVKAYIKFHLQLSPQYIFVVKLNLSKLMLSSVEMIKKVWLGD